MQRSYASESKRRQTKSNEKNSPGMLQASSKVGVPPFLAIEKSALHLEREATQVEGAIAASVQTVAADLGTMGATLHSDAAANRSAQNAAARAFTQGSDIYFNRGEFNPSTAAGWALIGHEMAHVAQQQSGAAAGATQSTQRCQ